MYHKIFSVLLLLLLVSGPVQSQQTNKAVEFVKYFKVAQANLPREQVFLHTDRDWYYFGDQIWFSAYTVSGGFNFPSNLSSVLYVELINPDGELISREVIELKDGRGNGLISFGKAPEKSGFYQIKAYTLWGLNFGKSYEFTKRLSILTDDSFDAPESAPVTDVQFLPEGGQLIESLAGNVGFKALDQFGMGKSVDGIVYDDTDKEVVSFSSEHLGMGSFSFTPEKGKSYYAIVDEHRYELPQVSEKGIALSISNSEDSFTFKLSSKGVNTKEPFLLFGHVRGEVYSAQLVSFDNGKSTLQVPKKNFATGVVHFTLLNPQGSPVAERLSFNRNQVDNVQLDISFEKPSYQTRDEVNVTSTLSSSDGDLLSASASISVFDDSVVPYNLFNSTIVTQFFLESELKGNVENPGYYFSNSEKADEHLNLLLLTQGWRAYDMSAIANRDEVTLETLPETGFAVSGTVKTLIGRKPLENASVMLTMGTDYQNPKIALTNKEGQFGFDGLTGFGIELITLKVEHPDKGSRVHVDLDQQFESFESEHNQVYQGEINFESDATQLTNNGSSIDTNVLQERSEQTQATFEQYTNIQMTGELDEISVTAERISDSYLDQVLGDLQGAGSSVDLDEQESLKNLPIEFVIGQLPGVKINKATNSLVIETGFKSVQSGKLPAIIFLDGVQIDTKTLFTLNSADVKTITVAKSAVDLSLIGADGAGGALLVTSQKNRVIKEKTRGITTSNLQAFQEPVAYYAPKYGINVPADIEQQDQRITLHWNPSTNFDQGLLRSRFWGNDVPSKYRFVVQGLTEDGIPFIASETFNLDQ